MNSNESGSIAATREVLTIGPPGAASGPLFRVAPVGDGAYELWKYMRVEARIGRELVID